MYYITYNNVITPHPYPTREDAVRELNNTFPNMELDVYDVAYWPSISARGHTKIEIKYYDGDME